MKAKFILLIVALSLLNAGLAAAASCTQADLTGDSKVDVFDLLALLKVLSGQTTNPNSDICKDGTTDIYDLLKLLRIMGGSSNTCTAYDIDGTQYVDIYDLLEMLRMLSSGNQACRGDLNNDCKVDIFDLLALLKVIGPNGPCPAQSPCFQGDCTACTAYGQTVCETASCAWKSSQCVSKCLPEKSACTSNTDCCTEDNLVCNTKNPNDWTTHGGHCCKTNEYWDVTLGKCWQFKGCDPACSNPFNPKCAVFTNFYGKQTACCSMNFQNSDYNLLQEIKPY